MTRITGLTYRAVNKEPPPSGVWDMTMRFFGAVLGGKSAPLKDDQRSFR